MCNLGHIIISINKSVRMQKIEEMKGYAMLTYNMYNLYVRSDFVRVISAQRLANVNYLRDVAHV